MGTVIQFAGHHARASSGKRSGRKAERKTPVSLSIGNTNSAGTPRLDLVSQYQTCPCVVPIRFASRFCPPARSQASLRASLRIIEASYQFLGDNQPKTMSGTGYRDFGRISGMSDTSAQGIGNRIRKRREKAGISQAKLAKSLGTKQQTVAGWENGVSDRPRLLFEAAKQLGTTHQWLLTGEGPEEPDGPFVSKEMILSEIDSLDPKDWGAALDALRKLKGKNAA
jgi:transcriptional regulator with XRE-family HTH domain